MAIGDLKGRQEAWESAPLLEGVRGAEREPNNPGVSRLGAAFNVRRSSDAGRGARTDTDERACVHSHSLPHSQVRVRVRITLCR